MASKQSFAAFVNGDLDPINNDDDPDFKGPWFTAATAMRYVPCKSIKGWYEWRKRHGIVPRANGTVAKRDLDRVLDGRKKRQRKPMAASSLANLTLRHAS